MTEAAKTEAAPAAEAKKEVKPVQVTVGAEGSTATLDGTKIEISQEGNVVVFTNEGVTTKPSANSSGSATAAAATGEDKQFSIGKDFNTVSMYGAKVELATDGSLIVYTNGTVKVKPAPANDTAIQAAKDALELGQKMADGSIYAGLTADGKSQIFAMAEDLDVTMTFNDAAKAVKKLNSQKVLGYDDWQIPSLDNLRILQKNQNEGSLKGTFNTTNKGSGSSYPDWYWSSTEHPDYSSFVYVVRFSDGFQFWSLKDYDRLSCRPVRLVAAVPAPARG